MTRILFYLDGFPHEPWQKAFQAADPSVEFLSYPNWSRNENGPTYALVWEPPSGLIREFPNIQAVFSLGAGVDHILEDDSLPTSVPVIRMGDDGLKEGMAEYVLMNVLMHHRHMPLLLNQQKNSTWKRVFSRPAANTRVGIMGYGALGRSAAAALRPLGYEIAAWSNSPKSTEQGVIHFTGQSALKEFLGRTDILICLLPETEETQGLLNSETLACLPEGAAVINAGRGSLIDIDALIHALDIGHISGATLDVVPEEPLAQNHPLWRHNKVIITPHIAAITRTQTAANYILDNIRKMELGEPPQNMLDRKRGY